MHHRLGFSLRRCRLRRSYRLSPGLLGRARNGLGCRCRMGNRFWFSLRRRLWRGHGCGLCHRPGLSLRFGPWLGHGCGFCHRRSCFWCSSPCLRFWLSLWRSSMRCSSPGFRLGCGTRSTSFGCGSPGFRLCCSRRSTSLGLRFGLRCRSRGLRRGSLRRCQGHSLHPCRRGCFLLFQRLGGGNIRRVPAIGLRIVCGCFAATCSR